jgi:hypothetical protein
MWRSGKVRQSRRAALSAVIGEATRSGSYREPWRSTPQVWEFFRDDAELLCELQREWRTALAGAVYVAIDAGVGDLPQDVRAAFDKVQRRHAGLRQILEEHADHPAIAASMRKERALLLWFLAPSEALSQAA